MLAAVRQRISKTTKWIHFIRWVPQASKNRTESEALKKKDIQKILSTYPLII